MPYGHNTGTDNEEESEGSERNGLVDSISAIVLILLAVAIASYFVDHL